MHTVYIDFINMKEKKRVIEQICTKNIVSISSLDIK